MIDFDPEDRTPGPATRKSSASIGLIAAGAVILLGLAGIVLFWGTLNGKDRFADVYAALQIDPLPVNLQNRREILPLLEKLQKERCDDKAAAGIGDALGALNEKRAAARFLAGFAGQCPRFNWLLFRAADYYYGVSDYAEARKISDRLVTQWPEIGQFHFLAGQIDQGLGLPAEAVVEFESTIERTPDRHSLTEAVFVEAAKAYAQLGQPCKSAALVRQWVSLDPAQRDTSASRKLIADYLNQGRCVG